jgi:DNA-binding response OmpR family regulator
MNASALVVGDAPNAPRFVRTVRGNGYRAGQG